MNTVLTNGHLKYKVNPKDHNPPHVHVEGGGASVRINLITLEVMDSKTDFNRATVNRIIEYVAKHRVELMEQWREYHG